MSDYRRISTWLGCLLLVQNVHVWAECSTKTACPKATSTEHECYTNGVVESSPNITVYVNQTAVFNYTALFMCNLKLYNNGCLVDKTQYTEYSINDTLTYISYAILNCQLSDNGRAIDLYTFSAGGINCFPTAYLIVRDPPSPPTNMSITLNCSILIIDGEWIDTTTELYVIITNIYDITIKTGILYSLPGNISLDTSNTTNTPLFIKLINFNPSGNSTEYIATLNLSEFITYELVSKSLLVIDDDIKFKLKITAPSCYSTLTPQINVVSSCIINHNYNISLENDIVSLTISVSPSKNCSLDVGIGHQCIQVFRHTNTFPVVAVEISNYSTDGYFMISCHLLKGAAGCSIIVISESGDTIFNQSIIHSKNETFASARSNHKIIRNGTYIVRVFTHNFSIEITTQNLTVILNNSDGESGSGSSDGGDIKEDYSGITILAVLILAALISVIIIATIVGTPIFIKYKTKMCKSRNISHGKSDPNPHDAAAQNITTQPQVYRPEIPPANPDGSSSAISSVHSDKLLLPPENEAQLIENKQETIPSEEGLPTVSIPLQETGNGEKIMLNELRSHPIELEPPHDEYSSNEEFNIPIPFELNKS